MLKPVRNDRFTCNTEVLLPALRSVSSASKFSSSTNYVCEIMIYICLAFVLSRQRALKILGISHAKSYKGAFCYVNEVAFVNHFRMDTGCQRNQPCD